ncbi:MAG: epoxyqueuosine reductase QueH [Thermodesulfovibrionales bacterium]|nr:epoxyqueuosine reductase QueH [Thermodesulfovibrionales bacterium]
MKELLMHTCCSNCTIYPYLFFKDRGIDVKCFWYNPNIHPYVEYKQRLDSMKSLESLWSLNIEYIDHYGLIEFIRNTTYNGVDRCEYCYRIRLQETAKKASELSIEAFTTSLLVSPFQKFDMIIDIGKEIENKYSVVFYFEDLRKGFDKGQKISKELGLYQQRYCGCIYSEMERFKKKSHKT